jgi:hypothetical protein
MGGCMMTNPLIEKYNELYGKKEEPKPDYYKGEKSYAEELEELRDTSTIPVSKIKSYDINSVNVSFHQVVEQVKKGEAQVSSMSMEMDIMYGTKITFEVYVDT